MIRRAKQSGGSGKGRRIPQVSSKDQKSFKAKGKRKLKETVEEESQGSDTNSDRRALVPIDGQPLKKKNVE